jgi:hypothetical protein
MTLQALLEQPFASMGTSGKLPLHPQTGMFMRSVV